MAHAGLPLEDVLKQRFEIGRSMSDLTRQKMSRQQAGFGAEIDMLRQEREIVELGDTPARHAMLADATERFDEAQRAIAECDEELAVLEGRLEELDRQIADRTET